MRALTSEDPEWGAFVSALERDRLATGDLDTPGQRFFAFDRDERVVGYGGYALTEDGVFLRSIIVTEGRGRGVGGSVVRALMEHGGREGAREAWLLTTDAASSSRASASSRPHGPRRPPGSRTRPSFAESVRVRRR